MHKITKGLKKKKKGKKSKHKEEELFKPEELEAYRREHQAHSASGAENEEWKKFLALTSGVDNVLQKTQEELSRIKETSFFQRVATPSEVKRAAEEEAKKEIPEQDRAPVEESQLPDPTKLGIVEVSDSESEGDDEEDDIFDTAYIDAIASGEVKLAYIPESPTEFGGDDPFDTSYAEKAILGPAAESKKGKKLVPIGAAVEVLTGRVQLPTCSTQRPAPSRRQVFKERDLLLGSFDDNANSIAECIKDSPDPPPKTLLDEEAPPDLSNEPIDLSKSLYIPPIPVTPSPLSSSGPNLEDSEDDEFAQLATENLNKEPKNIIETLPAVTPDVAQVIEDHWDAFADEKQEPQQGFAEVEEEPQLDIDPFDTTFAENILPGKAELKQIESEILNAQVEFEVKPKQEKLLHILKKLSISEEGARERDTASNLHTTQISRDLLGGSNTDLNDLNQPLRPAAQSDENYIEYCDPFDTSIVETVKKPGQAELKFIEKELLADIKNESVLDLNDDDFDPRAEEKQEPSRERSISRPDVLNFVSSKSVCFDTSVLNEKDFIEVPSNGSKLGKPPTPFYVRKNSVPGALEDDISPEPVETNTSGSDIFNSAIVADGYQNDSLDDFDKTENDFDPFDTSIANNVIY